MIYTDQAFVHRCGGSTRMQLHGVSRLTADMIMSASTKTAAF
jgi:hypothetical protein